MDVRVFGVNENDSDDNEDDDKDDDGFDIAFRLFLFRVWRYEQKKSYQRRRDLLCLHTYW